MKKKIAIVAGGDSGEYEVSVNSARVVARHLDPDLFEPYMVMIRGRDWHYLAVGGEEIPVNKDDFSLELPSGRVTFDAIFIAIHGTPGEDGKLQGYFDMIGIPYTSCGLATSALTFNKYFCNRFAHSIGLRIAPSILLNKGIAYDTEKIIEKLSLPVFVKPNNGGSSVGTTKVTTTDQLGNAIETAFREDAQVLVESFIPGREITCGVVTYRGEVRALPVTEIVSKKEFFDYEAKYHGKADEITPARIPAEVEQECKSLSLMLYKEMNCKGIVRIDFIFNGQGMFFLEVNTVPGLSEASIVPQQAAAEGISLKELFTETLKAALTG